MMEYTFFDLTFRNSCCSSRSLQGQKHLCICNMCTTSQSWKCILLYNGAVRFSSCQIRKRVPLWACFPFKSHIVILKAFTILLRNPLLLYLEGELFKSHLSSSEKKVHDISSFVFKTKTTKTHN